MDLGDLGSGEGGSRLGNVGGTPGGGGEFLIGIACLVGGGYLFIDRLIVSTGFSHFGPRGASGIALLPVFVGVVALFFNGRSKIAWGLIALGLLGIFVSVLMNLRIHFTSTSMWRTLGMLGLLGAGIGLVARSLIAHKK